MVKVRSDFPAGGHRLVAEMLHHFPRHPHSGGKNAAVAAHKAGNEEDGDIQELPIPLYTLPGGPAAALESAQHYGWRYLIQHPGEQRHRTADVTTATETELLSLTESSPEARAALDAFIAEAEAAGLEGELRWLEVPSVYLSLLWLHESGQGDGKADQFLDMRSFQKKTPEEVRKQLKDAGSLPGGGLAPRP